MLLAINRGLERFLAIRTHVRSHLAVSAEVTFETAIGGERAITNQTLVVLQASVRLHMSLEHTAGDKTTMTCDALVRLLSCTKENRQM